MRRIKPYMPMYGGYSKNAEGYYGLCVESGNTITVYGQFVNIDAADKFMDILAGLVKAVPGEEDTDANLDMKGCSDTPYI